VKGLRHRITIEIADDDLQKARAEFPATAPRRHPSEWTEMDVVHAMAALYHRHFKVVAHEALPPRLAEREERMRWNARVTGSSPDPAPGVMPDPDVGYPPAD